MIWLWQLDGKIDLHIDVDYAFRWSCRNGHLNIAQWLWQLDGKIDIHADNEFAFYWSYHKGYLDVTYWLWKLNEYRSEIIKWL